MAMLYGTARWAQMPSFCCGKHEMASAGRAGQVKPGSRFLKVSATGGGQSTSLQR